MRTEPVAIITSGGGMKCAYSGGALTALAKKLGLTDPDIYVSASGSVGNMFYFLARQFDAGETVWTRYVPTPEFISYFPVPKMRVDYLVDRVFREFMPLDVKRFEATPTRWFVPVVDEETGVANFLSNEYWLDPYEVMRAAKAIPILYNGHVRLGSHGYLDGDMATSTATLIQKALDAGARRILCITNTNAPSRLARIALKTYAHLQPSGLRDAVLNDIEQHKEIAWPENLQFTCLSPSEPLPVGVATRNRRKVCEAFYMGYDDLMAKSEEIKGLFAE
ncbi:MAG: hypothetical protein KGI41_04295 [Patescibacteria group bacterium]|nr:hypothetical protein [Patescibacteria group bacterium]MDE1966431.1 hypothetical protein [Patescibacteria group bacterium]